MVAFTRADPRSRPGRRRPGQEAEAARHAGRGVDGLEYEAFDADGGPGARRDRGRGRGAVRGPPPGDRAPVGRRAAGRRLGGDRGGGAAPRRRVRRGPLRDRRDQGPRADLEGRAIRPTATSGSATSPGPAPVAGARRGRHAPSTARDRRILRPCSSSGRAWPSRPCSRARRPRRRLGRGAAAPARPSARSGRSCACSASPGSTGTAGRSRPRSWTATSPGPAPAGWRDRAPVRDGHGRVRPRAAGAARWRWRRATSTSASRPSCSPSPTGARSRWPMPRPSRARPWSGSTRTGRPGASCSRCSATRAGRGSGSAVGSAAIVDALDEARSADRRRGRAGPGGRAAQPRARRPHGPARAPGGAWRATPSSRGGLDAPDPHGQPIPTGAQRALAVLRRFVDEAGARRRGYVRIMTDAQALAAPDQAVVAAFERIDVVIADPMREIVTGRVDPDRAIADHVFAHRLLASRRDARPRSGRPADRGAATSRSGVPSDPATRAGRALGAAAACRGARPSRRTAGRSGRRRRVPGLARRGVGCARACRRRGRAAARPAAGPPGRRSSSRRCGADLGTTWHAIVAALLPDAGEALAIVRRPAAPRPRTRRNARRARAWRRACGRRARHPSCAGTALDHATRAVAAAERDAAVARGGRLERDRRRDARVRLGPARGGCRRGADGGVRPPRAASARPADRPRSAEPVRAGELVGLVVRDQAVAGRAVPPGLEGRAARLVPERFARPAAARRPSRPAGAARLPARARRRSARTPCGRGGGCRAWPRGCRRAPGGAAGRTGCWARSRDGLAELAEPARPGQERLDDQQAPAVADAVERDAEGARSGGGSGASSAGGLMAAHGRRGACGTAWRVVDCKSQVTGSPTSQTRRSPEESPLMSVLNELQEAVAAVAASVGPSVVGIGSRLRGSGVVVADGRVLTNAHNLRGGEVDRALPGRPTAVRAPSRASTGTATSPSSRSTPPGPRPSPGPPATPRSARPCSRPPPRRPAAPASRSGSCRPSSGRSGGPADAGSRARSSTPRRWPPVRPAARCSTRTARWPG